MAQFSKHGLSILKQFLEGSLGVGDTLKIHLHSSLGEGKSLSPEYFDQTPALPSPEKGSYVSHVGLDEYRKNQILRELRDAAVCSRDITDIPEKPDDQHVAKNVIVQMGTDVTSLQDAMMGYHAIAGKDGIVYIHYDTPNKVSLKELALHWNIAGSDDPND